MHFWQPDIFHKSLTKFEQLTMTGKSMRQAAFDSACAQFAEEVLTFENQADFFKQVTRWVPDLARNRPNLFRLLYLSDGFHGNNFLEVMMGFESNKKGK